MFSPLVCSALPPGTVGPVRRDFWSSSRNFTPTVDGRRDWRAARREERPARGFFRCFVFVGAAQALGVCSAGSSGARTNRPSARLPASAASAVASGERKFCAPGHLSVSGFSLKHAVAGVKTVEDFRPCRPSGGRGARRGRCGFSSGFAVGGAPGRRSAVRHPRSSAKDGLRRDEQPRRPCCK